MVAENKKFQENLGLALSGGGVRAAAFHAGALRYLAEQGRLDNVKHISSVSGGSLFVGLVMSRAGGKWPTSTIYKDSVFDAVRGVLTTTSLQRTAAFLLAKPSNWRFAFFRANVLEQAIRSVWQIDGSLGDIEHSPIWSINGTTGETGRRFRFKSGMMGEYETGYASVNSMSIASALAVSAAFPGGIGPLSVRSHDFEWMKRPSWNSSEAAQPYVLPFDRLHLYDGGIYDNLGVEPLFDTGRQAFKKDAGIDRLIVSDAGAALARSAIPHPLNPKRFKRLADIALDQARALRVRSFANFLQKEEGRGLYLRLGDKALESIGRFAAERPVAALELSKRMWLSSEKALEAASFPTSLQQLTEEEFDLISLHGFQTAEWNHRLWS